MALGPVNFVKSLYYANCLSVAKRTAPKILYGIKPYKELAPVAKMPKFTKLMMKYFKK